MQRGEHGLHGSEKFFEGIRELCYYMMSDDQHHANLERELQRFFQHILGKLEGEVDSFLDQLYVNPQTILASEEVGMRQSSLIFDMSKVLGVGLIHYSCISLLK